MVLPDLAPAVFSASVDTHTSRLIVTRRGSADGIYRAIGYLDKITSNESVTYSFAYITSAVEHGSVVPLVGFSDFDRVYRSPRLFPSFADRVISARRPDRSMYLTGLDLDSAADSWEILTASGGHREGDPIEVISLPTWDPVTRVTSAYFLTHGVRYRDKLAQAHLATLEPGRVLTLEAEPTNKVNHKAVRVISNGLHLGYVPDPLVEHVTAVADTGPYEVRVVRANPADTHPHLRLLVRLTGTSGRFVFDEPHWAACESALTAE